MGQLFKTAACFTDIHYGLKQNSRLHIEDCSRFVDWFIAEAKARNAETCIFLGDWSHHRASISVATMNASIKDLKKIKLEVFYENGKENGFWKQWYKNGLLRSSVKFINGIKDGEELTFNEDGSIRSKDIYLNGKVIDKN